MHLFHNHDVGHHHIQPSLWSKFTLLMWKNFLQQWRHKIQTLTEIIMPLSTMVLVLAYRSQVKPATKDPISFTEFSAHSINDSIQILGSMNVSEISLIYSPENSLLEKIVSNAFAKMFALNIDLLPVDDKLPNAANLPIEVLVTLIKGHISIVGYKRADDLKNIYASEEKTRLVLAAVEFSDSYKEITELPKDVTYTLRFPERPRTYSFFGKGSITWFTDKLFPIFEKPGPRIHNSSTGGHEPGYASEMFLALQSLISLEIIETITGEKVKDFEFKMKRFPHHAWVDDEGLMFLRFIMPILIIFSYSYNAVNIVRAVVVEKENQLKEHMKIMGLSTWLHWAAWFWKQIIYLTISVILVIILLKVKWFRTDDTNEPYCVLVNTSPQILFFFLMMYMTSVVCFCFMMSSFFSQGNIATLFSGIVWFITFIPSFLLSMDATVPSYAQMLTCIFNNSALAFGIQMIVSKESVGGIKWSDMKRSRRDDANRIHFGDVVMMLAIDSVMYFLLCLYFEQVIPGKFGARKPWHFFLKRSFWQNQSKTAPGLSRVDMVPYSSSVVTDANTVRDVDPKDLEVGVKIKKLSKQFGKFTAVNNLSFNIYNNQITALLGHNGAGKTTAMSMITGNLKPTRGTVVVAGYDLRKNLLMARANIGFCPQHNVLFDELTVKEHLDFYMRLKGFGGPQLKDEIRTLIAKLELGPKTNTEARALSGGQKRRLQVGIALCGRSRVVLLDEPTSGMDPASRRGLWDLLQSEKKERSIILSTHFMDEADILGDRIAILAHGKLVCIGTSHFLKQHYGVGYTLTIDKDEDFSADKCTSLITRHVPDAQIKEESVRYITYVLPNQYTNRFEALFSDLDSKTKEIKVIDYGVTATTLEDVFLRVGADIAVNRQSISSHLHNSDMKHPSKLDKITSTSAASRTMRFRNVRSRTDNENTDTPNDDTGRFNDVHSTKAADAPSSVSFYTNPAAPATSSTTNLYGIPKKRNSKSFFRPSTVSRLGKDKPLSGGDSLNDINKAEYLIHGCRLIIQHILCVWRKLWIIWSRSWLMVILVLLVPIAALGCSLAFVRFLSSLTGVLNKRELSLEKDYVNTETLVTFLGTKDDSPGALAKTAYEKYFEGKSNMGLTAVNESFETYYLDRTEASSDLVYARTAMLIGAEFGDKSVTAWFSNFGYHDIATSLATAQLAILKAKDPEANIRVINYPLQAQYKDQSNMQVLTTMLAMQVGCGMGISIGLISASFIMFYIKENTSQALLLQKAAGIKPVVLWFASFIFDWVWFAFTFIPIALCCVYFDVSGLKTADELARVFMCFMIFGAAILPMIYYTSKRFTAPAYGLSMVFFFHVVVGMMCPQVVQALIDAKASPVVINALDYTLQFHPLYSLTSSIMKINKLGMIIWNCLEICEYLKRVSENITECNMKVMCNINPADCCVRENSFFEWADPGVLRYLVVIIFSGIIAWCVLMISEYRLLRKCKRVEKHPPHLERNTVDDDVWNEKLYVDSIVGKRTDKDILVADGITKYYKNNYLAVNQISFTVADGDCFGLLGINGAGKTTTFKMLMGEEIISQGDAYICHHSVKKAISRVYHHIGYCPQFDALFEEFTGRETLRYYCMLRGFRQNKIKNTIDVLGRILGFSKHLHKQTYTYSGGNKRKLSTAIALIGDIRLIFVDEPTTGVDAAAKRQVWSAIQEAQKAGRGVVLTSHSMEECEALCTRLTVMVNGRFQCIGTPQRLKNKFSQGLTLTIKMELLDDPIENYERTNRVKAYVADHFKNFKIMEEYQGLITYYLQDTTLTWSQAFGIMEKAKQEVDIEDYTVSQTTLEQIFLQFTKYQKSGKD